MTSLVRTELLRLRTTRTPWALAVLFLALSIALMVLARAGIGTPDGPQPGTPEVRDLYVGSVGLAALLLPMLLGALATADEFHHRTATSTFLIAPDRGRLVMSKVIAHSLLGVVIGGTLTMLGIAFAVIGGAGEHVDVAFLVGVGGVLVMSGWAGAMGVCLGTVVHSSAAAAVAPVLWFVVVEPLLGAYQLITLRPWTPGGAITAVSGADVPWALPGWAALLVLLGYAGALGILGTRRIVRADID
jgi:ABC-type transport system involved in multi-copper enzyme maturation permease subunit